MDSRSCMASQGDWRGLTRCAQVRERMTAEGRAVLEHWLPTYRAQGQAEGDVVASLERVLADSTRRSR
jgi:hypothetical protein